jgi:peptidoglycan hydrolase-like protein with peptidoglycan-binding domain
MHLKSIFGFLLILSLVIIGSLSKTTSQAQTNTIFSEKDFNQNYLLSDESFVTKKIFPHERSIQEYLDQVNSPLRNYTTEGAKASHWIWTAATGQTSSNYNVKPNLNPGMLLAYLEKEQSLLSLSGYDTASDPEKRILTAMGFGCPDDGVCANKYKGFVNQMNYAAYQLQFNYNIAVKDKTEMYRVGNTVTTLDKKEVFLSNAATAAAYRYTPHVFYSAYNLWKIMSDKGWGATGQPYQGNAIDNTSVNVTLRPGFLVNFDDEVANVNAENSPVITIPQSNVTTNCDELIKKDWKYGIIDVSVERLQECLVSKNVFDHAVTGYFGQITKAALDKVRSGNTTTQNPIIIQNGNIPQYNSNVIVITSDPKPIPQNNPTNDNCLELKVRDWKYGTTSDDVEKLQRCMQKLGIFNHVYGATGYFGDVTKKALAEWRK